MTMDKKFGKQKKKKKNKKTKYSQLVPLIFFCYVIMLLYIKFSKSKVIRLVKFSTRWYCIIKVNGKLLGAQFKGYFFSLNQSN